MATTRDEAVVSLGIDLSGLERGLGVGRNYMEEFRVKEMSSEAKYSAWWNTELKRRGDAEVAASIEAASRANKARALYRERDAAAAKAQAIANAEIAAGSTGAGFASGAG